MTKQELINVLRAKKEAAGDAEFKDNESLKNIETKVVEDVKAAEDMPHEELPTEKEVAKEVEAAVEPVVDADKDGISKNGGECEMGAECVEKCNDKIKSELKDVINVTGRTYEEQAEVQKELLAKLEESVAANEKLKAEMANIQKVCKEALEAQKEQFTKASAAKTEALIESIIEIGENMERSMTAELENSKKNLAKVESTLKQSNRLNNILREGLLASKPAAKMVRYESAMKKLTKMVA